MPNVNSNTSFSAVNVNASNTLPAELSITNSSVPESCLKEILPCEILPLGYHLSAQVKDKIWKGQLIEILSLLPSAKEFINRSDKKNQKIGLRKMWQGLGGFGGLGWYQYNKSFRQKLSIYPSLKWDNKDIGLWLNLIVPQKPVYPTTDLSHSVPL